MKKKIIAVFCVMLLASGAAAAVPANGLTQTVYRAVSAEPQGKYYKQYKFYFDESTGTITGADKDLKGAVDIPDKIGTTEVKAIADMVFAECTGIGTISIPDTVTDIGTGALSGGYEIKTTKNNKSYYAINGVLFNKDRTVLIQYPAGKTEEMYVVPDTVKKIEPYAFYGAKGLVSVTIPNGVTDIGESAFENSEKLDFVKIPGSVSVVRKNTFRGGKKITRVEVSDGVTQFEENAFSDCPMLAGIKFPQTLEKIGDKAFSGCTDLTKIILPPGIKVLGSGIFSGCTALYDITLPEDLPEVADSMFSGCTAITAVRITEGIKIINGSAFSGCSALKSVTLPESLEQIGASAFSGCSALKEIAYNGKKNNWYSIFIDGDNDKLIGSSILLSDGSTITGKIECVLSPQTVYVNGVKTDFEVYNIGGSNYFKLRDIAYVLSGTTGKFSVGWDSAASTVTLTSGYNYEPVGGELMIGEDKSYTAVPSSQRLFINGEACSDLSVYSIGGNNFIKLRDLGAKCAFIVDYDIGTNSVIINSK